MVFLAIISTLAAEVADRCVLAFTAVIPLRRRNGNVFVEAVPGRRERRSWQRIKNRRLAEPFDEPPSAGYQLARRRRLRARPAANIVKTARPVGSGTAVEVCAVPVAISCVGSAIAANAVDPCVLYALSINA
jgi:hypothetical protein